MRTRSGRAKCCASPIAVLVASVCVGVVACGDKGGTSDAAPIDARPAAGTFSFSWTLVDGAVDINCADVGAVAITTALTSPDATAGASDSFSCTAGSVTSRGLAPGVYDVEITLRAASGQALTNSVSLSDIVIMEGQDTAVGNFAFDVARVGVLRFSVNAQLGTSNCAGSGASNAGLVETRLELRDALGVCVSSSFDVGVGSGVSGTYNNTCGVPPVFGCIDRDQNVVLDPAPSGTHSLVVQGLRAAMGGGQVTCFSYTAQVTIPGAGLAYELGQVQLQQLAGDDCS